MLKPSHDSIFKGVEVTKMLWRMVLPVPAVGSISAAAYSGTPDCLFCFDLPHYLRLVCFSGRSQYSSCPEPLETEEAPQPFKVVSTSSLSLLRQWD